MEDLKIVTMSLTVVCFWGLETLLEQVLVCFTGCVLGHCRTEHVTGKSGKAVACSGLDLCRLWRLHSVSVVAASVCAYVHGPVPRGPLTPSPLTPCPSPQETLKVRLHPHIMMFHPVHGAVPRGPPNPKSPNPLSQPPRNPKGVLLPEHHDVPATHHFFLFFKGCTATSDGILASHLWLLQVTEFLVSQVTCLPAKVQQIFVYIVLKENYSYRD